MATYSHSWQQLITPRNLGIIWQHEVMPGNYVVTFCSVLVTQENYKSC